MKIADMPLRTRVLITLTIYFVTGVAFGVVPTDLDFEIAVWFGLATLIITYTVMMGALSILLPDLFFPERIKKN